MRFGFSRSKYNRAVKAKLIETTPCGDYSVVARPVLRELMMKGLGPIPKEPAASTPPRNQTKPKAKSKPKSETKPKPGPESKFESKSEPEPDLAAIYAERFKIMRPNVGDSGARARAYEHAVGICCNHYGVDNEKSRRSVRAALAEKRGECVASTNAPRSTGRGLCETLPRYSARLTQQ